MSQLLKTPRSIAVVGGGVAGLGAAWTLSHRHRVTLYDREARFGGHANTVEIALDGGMVPVDTGFIVYNELNYPNLVALFNQLGVETVASEMSFGVSLDGGRLEYSGSDTNGLFAQRLNALRPRFWRMLSDIRRFYASADGYLDTVAGSCSIGELLDREGYSEAFASDHLVPMAAAIWSASRDDIRNYPADSFIRFFDNHGLLNLGQRPQWHTVKGGSREYVARLLADSEVELAAATEVAKITRGVDAVRVTDVDGGVEMYDDVVIATHADQALNLLDDADDTERSVLGTFGYSSNRAWLHEDESFMPRRRAAWSSWNYLQAPGHSNSAPLSVSYWMNRLQALPSAHQIFVTLNPVQTPDERKVHGCFDYEHPIFTAATSRQQERSALIQGCRRTWFCGSYFGHGFHEDALQSGLWVAEQLGARRPWGGDGEFDRLPETYRGETSRAA
jgi:predicted NAD/FAD-binding protein